MNDAGQEVLVVLSASPALEEVVIDWLIGRPGSAGFTSLAASGHGSRHQALSSTEQVAGRQKRVQFQVILPQAGLREFLQSARQEFAGTDLHYWVLPVLASGRMADYSD
jgi:hypothetical protein